jgi:Protein of unknown function (DUF1203)
MQFRIRDLAAERCVWSIPPVGTVPTKLRCQTLGVRAFDVHGKMVGQTLSESGKLADAIARLFADGRARCLQVHFAADGTHAARVDRFTFSASTV